LRGSGKVKSYFLNLLRCRRIVLRFKTRTEKQHLSLAVISRNMSYHIYFLKNKKLNHDNVHDFLESEIQEGEPGYITIEERLRISEQMQLIGIPFKELITDNKIQLNSDSYEILIFKSLIGIGIPYWKENKNGMEIPSMSKLRFALKSQ
jgi:hypothetical protein